MSNTFCSNHNFLWIICATFLGPCYLFLRCPGYISCVFLIIFDFRIFSYLQFVFYAILFFVVFFAVNSASPVDLLFAFFLLFQPSVLSLSSLFPSFRITLILSFIQRMSISSMSSSASIVRMWFPTESWCRLAKPMLQPLHKCISSSAAWLTCSQWNIATTTKRWCGWASSRLRIRHSCYAMYRAALLQVWLRRCVHSHSTSSMGW